MVARYLERRLEQLVEGLAGRVFRGAIQPGELASRLLREADLALQDSPAGPRAANHFTITTKVTDQGDDLGDVEAEIAAFLEDASAQRGWRLGGPVIVRIVPTANHQGRPAVECAFVSADRLPWALLDFRDERRLITDNRVLIGRSDQSDIVLSQPEVSRTHALLYREGGRSWIEDQRSANGLAINGVRVARAELWAGSTVSFGSIMATFRVV